jgi:hypothetical protein
MKALVDADLDFDAVVVGGGVGGSTHSIVYVNWGFQFASTRQVAGSAEPGIGIDILVRVAMLKVSITRTRFLKSCSRNGTGRRDLRRNRKFSTTSIMLPTGSICAET